MGDAVVLVALLTAAALALAGEVTGWLRADFRLTTLLIGASSGWLIAKGEVWGWAPLGLVVVMEVMEALRAARAVAPEPDAVPDEMKEEEDGWPN